MLLTFSYVSFLIIYMSEDIRIVKKMYHTFIYQHSISILRMFLGHTPFYQGCFL